MFYLVVLEFAYFDCLDVLVACAYSRWVLWLPCTFGVCSMICLVCIGFGLLCILLICWFVCVDWVDLVLLMIASFGCYMI